MIFSKALLGSSPSRSISFCPIFLSLYVRGGCASRSIYTGQASILDQWVQQEARPISLRQLTFFGRTLTEGRLLSSANYVRNELPTRLAHRLRDMQSLPYAVITNRHMSHVYDLYYMTFDKLRQVPVIKTTDDNNQFCQLITETLKDNLTVIPRLAMGVLEVQDLIPPEDTDRLMTTLLRSRISRRVIAEQHLALTETFASSRHSPNLNRQQDPDFVGEVFLKCNAKEAVQSCAKTSLHLLKEAYGSDLRVPEVKIQGHLNATFPYVLSHLRYILGELLRNSVQAVIEKYRNENTTPPIEVLICETKHHVIIRISDQGGGIGRKVLGNLWSFSKGPQRQKRIENLRKVPHIGAVVSELRPSMVDENDMTNALVRSKDYKNSLSGLYGRSPEVRLGIGLPMSKVYAEYWAGKLDLHNLEGYGVDVFLQISKLGNNPEQIERASMDEL